MSEFEHRVPLVRVEAILPIAGADNIGIVEILGYQVVIRKDEWEPGMLGFYVPPDSVVPDIPAFSFLWKDSIGPTIKDRRVTARRFKKTWSEGLLMHVHDFTGLNVCPDDVIRITDLLDKTARIREFAVGDDCAELLGIEHYNPPEPLETGENESEPGKHNRKHYPRSLKGWFYFLLRVLFGYDRNGAVGGAEEAGPVNHIPEYDVSAYKNFANVLKEGEQVIITEKIHGCNGRFVYRDGKMYVGSHRRWKKAGSNVWRNTLAANPWIEEWCRNNEGYILYGEVTPTQTGFDYGSQNGQYRFFVFDIRTPDGMWMPFDEANYALQPSQEPYITPSREAFCWVPLLYRGPWKTEFLSFADGKSFVEGAKNIREGIVILAEDQHPVIHLGRRQLKVVSNKYYEAQKGN